MAVSFIGGGNRKARRKLPTCRKLYQICFVFLESVVFFVLDDLTVYVVLGINIIVYHHC